MPLLGPGERVPGQVHASTDDAVLFDTADSGVEALADIAISDDSQCGRVARGAPLQRGEQ